MKILYSAGNRVGADIQLRRFLDKNKHDVRIAAYLKSSYSLSHIDWVLDSLTNKYKKGTKKDLVDLLGHSGTPHVGIKEIEILLDEISDWEPDLVICDGEPIVSNIAYSLGLRLWYCSPLHLFDGIKWERGQLRYASLLAKTRQMLNRLPKAEKTFIYSPFGDIAFRPTIKPGYEWIQPYHHKVIRNSEEIGIAVIRDPNRISILSKILNCIPPFNFTLFSPFAYNLSHVESKNINDIEKYKISLSKCKWVFTTGETGFIADVIYNGIDRLCITPDLNDPEALLNAILCRNYGIGDDIGQAEYLGKYSVAEIERSFLMDGVGNYTSNQNRNYLHEKIDELCHT